jgi:putative peptidoglycan lipid II flippase
MGLVLYLGAGDIDTWLAMGGGERAWRLCLWVLAGGSLYGAALFASGIRPRHLLQV